jgi:hypothetical protein
VAATWDATPEKSASTLASSSSSSKFFFSLSLKSFFFFFLVFVALPSPANLPRLRFLAKSFLPISAIAAAALHLQGKTPSTFSPLPKPS